MTMFYYNYLRYLKKRPVIVGVWDKLEDHETETSD